MACNGCVDVCPENLIRLVGLSKLIEDEAWMEQAVEEFGDLSRSTPPEELDAAGRRDDEGRDHLHPLRHVRLALPHARHPDEALRFPPRVRDRAGAQPEGAYVRPPMTPA